MLSVLRAVAAHRLHDHGDVIRQEPLTDGAWRRLLDSVRDHRLPGLLAAAVTDEALPVTDAQRDDLEVLETDAARSAVLLERTLLEAAELLAGANIDFRVLKGSAVAHLDYPDPVLRHFGDVDLLIPADDLEAAASVLTAAGGVRAVPELAPGFDRRFGKGFTIMTGAGSELDIHRTFVAGTFGFRLDPSDLFRTVQHFELGGQRIPALGLHERFTHACFHAALGNARPRLSAVRDVAQMAAHRNLDWDGVRMLAARWRCEAVVVRALELVSERLGLSDHLLLSAWARELNPSPKDRRAIDDYLATDGRFAGQALGAIRDIEGWRAKLAYVGALALPDHSHLSGRNRSRVSHLTRGARRALSRKDR